MSLISAINNTNIQKENLKIVAVNIDNKLVELGGEQATNLSDVPNKIDSLKASLKKIYIKNVKQKVTVTSGYDMGYNFSISPDFEVEKLYIQVQLGLKPNLFTHIIDSEVANKSNKLNKFFNSNLAEYIFFLQNKGNNIWNLAFQYISSIYGGASSDSIYIDKIIAIGE